MAHCSRSIIGWLLVFTCLYAPVAWAQFEATPVERVPVERVPAERIPVDRSSVDRFSGDRSLAASQVFDRIRPENTRFSACWTQHSPTFHLWTCASQGLPVSAQGYAHAVGVIEGERSVLLIDPGASSAVGEQLALDVIERFPEHNLVVVNTQAKPELFLGTVGVRDVVANEKKNRFPLAGRIVAGQGTAQAMMQNCPQCLSQFADESGNPSVLGIEVLVPDFTLKRPKGALKVFDPVWVNWRYQLVESLETDEVMVLSNRQEGVYWVGNAVQRSLVPKIAQGKVSNRLNYLAMLRSEVRPGDKLLSLSGPISTDWLNRNMVYFRDLQVDVLSAIESAVSEDDAVRRLQAQLLAASPGITAPDLANHALNVRSAYRELENSML